MPYRRIDSTSWFPPSFIQSSNISFPHIFFLLTHRSRAWFSKWGIVLCLTCDAGKTFVISTQKELLWAFFNILVFILFFVFVCLCGWFFFLFALPLFEYGTCSLNGQFLDDRTSKTITLVHWHKESMMFLLMVHG